jgi:hypothetical protein
VTQNIGPEQVCKELIVLANWYEIPPAKAYLAQALREAEQLIFDKYAAPDWQPVLPTAQLDWPEHWRPKVDAVA